MRNKELIVTEEHLKLLKEMYVSWNGCEWGAPTIDPKRPYGNGDIFGDMAKILDIGTFNEDEGCLECSEEEIDFMKGIHREMKHVLQILVRNLEVKAGKYVESRWLEWEYEGKA